MADKKKPKRRTARGDRTSSAEGEGEEGSQRRADSGQGGGFGEIFRTLIYAAILFVVVRALVLETFVITSGSMEDTLLVGDFLVVNRAAMGGQIPFTPLRIPGYSEPERGDVLVFDPPHEEELKLVKRLIGLPGDTLMMRDKVLYRNGERQEEPYVRFEDSGDEVHPWMVWQQDVLLDTVDAASYTPTRDNWGPLVVPEGHYFMLGDNRDTSLDSRYWGLLEAWRVEGRVSFIYFSYDKESMRPFPWIREVRWGRIFEGVD